MVRSQMARFCSPQEHLDRSLPYAHTLLAHSRSIGDDGRTVRCSGTGTMIHASYPTTIYCRAARSHGRLCLGVCPPSTRTRISHLSCLYSSTHHIPLLYISLCPSNRGVLTFILYPQILITYYLYSKIVSDGVISVHGLLK